MKLSINMNDSVRVRLTPFGRKVLEQSHYDLYKAWERPPAYQPPDEKDGVSEWQLWVLFQEFGHVIHLGCDTPFDNDIEVVSR